MKTVKNLSLLITFALLGAIVLQCNIRKKNKAEGTIVYDVTFPYLEDPILANVFPEEMKLTFQGENTHGYLKSLGGIVTSEFISDERNRTFVQLLKAFSDRYVMELNEEQVRDYLSIKPQMEFTSTGKTKEICGYTCYETIANFKTDSTPPVHLYHTKELDIPSPNWFNQYAKIEEVLLGYEIEQYGMRMKLTAREVDINGIDNSVFIVDPKYQTINARKMESVIDSMMGNLRGTSLSVN